ncbi:sensor histidine kinase [Arthrobacter bambusae]|uniref:histidine kinase n=1 Tax=Arthrobacter bambusae TaxID=1338426 RepID=A0AAW8DL55_9MICC|nr:HAMP domain-containing sensor histidine kinase [Arthrobacter bambusae]MDP9906534.1 two-component system OmpR family sensor kinase [Arthrobacter bambusae]MDQ0130028.1 two-component system OmpR family sensor kinase [Arthrobacter bambusae]MDQ0181408.1 two-component system OmpR family sensor kinase [Arthrobacter bambusae]
MFNRWKSASLRSQLVAIIMGLLLLALAATGAGTLTLVKSYLQGQVDDKLRAAVQIAQQQQSFANLSEASPAVPTDYSLTLYVQGQPPYPFGGSKTDRPSIANITPGEAKNRNYAPFQVNGTAGGDWRVVAVNVVDNRTGQNAVVIVGLPLSPVDRVMEHATLVVVGVGLLTLVLAFFIATWTVARSFRPLARVEKTAAAIAAGDLSRRVDIENPVTEVGRLGASLNAMLAHIESSFAARAASEARMRRFAADASHELRTPLVTIRGFSELYRHGALATPEDVGTAMGRIESEAKRMGSMVEDLLLLARLDEQRPLQLKPVDLHLLANDAVVDSLATSGERKISLTGLDGGAAAPAPVQGDEAKLRQVLGNLVGNALRYTPEGTPIELAVGVRNTPAGPLSVLEVRDHGSGIPAEELPRIFERFYRADTSRTRETGGSGLGLAIVAAIVGSHRGTVRVEETDGGGATLVVSLPFQDELSEVPEDAGIAEAEISD